MKKTISFLICIMLIISVFGCVDNQTPVKNNLEFWCEDNTQKVWKEDLTTNKTTTELDVCKGEYEGFQIILKPDYEIDSFDIKINDFRSGDLILAKENFSVFRQHYFKIDTLYNDSMKSGYVPDALIPFDKAKQMNENTIKENETYGIWITSFIPLDTVAGIYNGSVDIITKDKTVKVQIKITVYDFSIEDNHVNTAFAIWIDDMCDIWSNDNKDIHKVDGSTEKVKEIYTNYYNFLLDYRISATDLPLLWSEKENVSKVVSEAKKATLNPKVASYNIPVKELQTDDGISQALLKSLLRKMIEESSNEVNLFKKAYMYIPKIDEPLYQNLIPLAARVNEIAENTRTSLINDDSLWANKASVKTSFANFRHVMTADLDERLYGITETWCPYFDQFDTAAKRNDYYNRRDNHGEGIWWYGCVGPKYPQPTFHMNDTMASPRVIGWMQNIYKIEGQLYWTVNLSRQMKDDNKYHIRDIWNEAYSFYNVAGDGYIVYPGEKYGMDSPIPSIRLEAIRDGFEDYEYLYLLEKYSEAAKEQYSLQNYNYISSTQYLSDLMFNGTKPTPKKDNISYSKQELSKLIMLAKNNVLVDYNKNTGKCLIYTPSNTTSVLADGETVSPSSASSFNTFSLNNKSKVIIKDIVLNY